MHISLFNVFSLPEISTTIKKRFQHRQDRYLDSNISNVCFEVAWRGVCFDEVREI